MQVEAAMLKKSLSKPSDREASIGCDQIDLSSIVPNWPPKGRGYGINDVIRDQHSGELLEIPKTRRPSTNRKELIMKSVAPRLRKIATYSLMTLLFLLMAIMVMANPLHRKTIYG
jgi:hypothetical protein